MNSDLEGQVAAASVEREPQFFISFHGSIRMKDDFSEDHFIINSAILQLMTNHSFAVSGDHNSGLAVR